MANEAPAPFNATEVRAWLREQGRQVGSRGRIAVELHRAYLDANTERAKQIARELGTMPKNRQLGESHLDKTALLMARPGLRAQADAA